jgi:hypothetical protein
VLVCRGGQSKQQCRACHQMAADMLLWRFWFKGKLESQLLIPTVACIFWHVCTYQLHRVSERERERPKTATGEPMTGFSLNLVLGSYGWYTRKQRSRYSNWLRAGQPRGRSSSPGRDKIFLLSASFIPALRPTQPSVYWVLVFFSSGVKQSGREAEHTSIQCRNYDCLEL